MIPFYAVFDGDPGDPNILMIPAFLCLGLFITLLVFLWSKLSQKYPSKIGKWVVITLVAAFCIYLMYLPFIIAVHPNEIVPVVTNAPRNPSAARIAH